jgi:hypothetical protein
VVWWFVALCAFGVVSWMTGRVIPADVRTACGHIRRWFLVAWSALTWPTVLVLLVAVWQFCER